MDDDTLKSVMTVFGIIVLIAGVIFAVSYRDVKTVTIDDRAWEYVVRVQYDVETTTIDCDTDDRGVTTCDTSTHTTTYTRCSARNQDNKLPVVRPVPSCAKWFGDYESDSIYYTVMYHDDSGKTGYSRFSGDRWIALAPGSVVKLTLNVFNTVVEIDGKD